MSLDTEGIEALLARPALAKLLKALDGGGEETRVVGGAVRDALLGRAIGEIDLATTALPAETIRRAARAGLKTIPTGIDHGTVTVVVDGAAFEVTTLRTDVQTDGRHALVRFGRDFAADALRRDFTVNALSIGRDGRLHDATGGLGDLEARRIRFIGGPLARIREDYLRILRFFRFWAEYAEGPIDPAGLDGAIRGREGLRSLSAERVRAELLRLMAARRCQEAVGQMQRAGLLGLVVSAIADEGRLDRAASAGGDPLTRLAAALVRTGADADRLRQQLRLSNAEHGRLAAFAGALARLLDRTGPIDAAEARRALAVHGLEAARDAAAALAGEPRPTWTPEGRAELADIVAGRRQPPRFGGRGSDLIREGVPPGPEIGRRLAEARSAWLDAGCPES